MSTLFSPQENTLQPIEQAEIIDLSPADHECVTQALMKKYCPTKLGESVVDEFIAERRLAAETE